MTAEHSPPYPTPQHQRAAEQIVSFFQEQSQVDAVLLVNSCARGTATPESDLDLAVLINPATSGEARRGLEEHWREYEGAQPVFAELRRLGPLTGIHLKFPDGQFVPQVWDDGGGPDDFELRIGNQVAYSVPLWEGNGAFARLREQWLPYYGEALRTERLVMVRDACRYDLDHVPFFVGRGLHFQAFDRLYKALQEFLKALHIARRTHPIAYNKWIHEQVAVRLGLPELCA